MYICIHETFNLLKYLGFIWNWVADLLAVDEELICSVIAASFSCEFVKWKIMLSWTHFYYMELLSLAKFLLYYFMQSKFTKFENWKLVWVSNGAYLCKV